MCRFLKKLAQTVLGLAVAFTALIAVYHLLTGKNLLIKESPMKEEFINE